MDCPRCRRRSSGSGTAKSDQHHCPSAVERNFLDATGWAGSVHQGCIRWRDRGQRYWTLRYHAETPRFFRNHLWNLRLTHSGRAPIVRSLLLRRTSRAGPKALSSDELGMTQLKDFLLRAILRSSRAIIWPTLRGYSDFFLSPQRKAHYQHTACNCEARVIGYSVKGWLIGCYTA